VDSRWCDNAGVRLHFLDSGEEVTPTETPVFVVPGWPEAADEYAWLGARLTDRRVVIADVRGRGPSDAPAHGYTWQHHVGDLEAVVAGAALPPPILVAFSRGSSYALGYALAHDAPVRGLVIGDYPALHVRLGPEFVEGHARMVVRDIAATERVAPQVVERLVAESEDVPLWERLRDLDCSVLLVRGGRPGALVGDDREARYRAALPTIRVALLPGAGHDLWSHDVDAYLGVLRPFLDECDRANRTAPVSAARSTSRRAPPAAR
jgi:pimeloyl-ACP methyl ester carboxylesterase